MSSINKAEGKSKQGERMHLASRDFSLAFILLISSLALFACRQDMHDQPKYRPLRASDFFPDGQSARPLVAGTVARGQLREDLQYYTGKTAKFGITRLGSNTSSLPASEPVQPGAPSLFSALKGYVTTFPFPITREVLDRGQDRYNVFCTPCHDRVGTGQGMVVRRGYRRPPSFHMDRLRQAPAGYFFDVITNGFGAMPDYAAQILPEDRWAVVAYLRALQLSQYVPVSEIPLQKQAQLPAGGPTP